MSELNNMSCRNVRLDLFPAQKLIRSTRLEKKFSFWEPARSFVLAFESKKCGPCCHLIDIFRRYQIVSGSAGCCWICQKRSRDILKLKVAWLRSNLFKSHFGPKNSSTNLQRKTFCWILRYLVCTPTKNNQRLSGLNVFTTKYFLINLNPFEPPKDLKVILDILFHGSSRAQDEGPLTNWTFRTLGRGERRLLLSSRLRIQELS